VTRDARYQEIPDDNIPSLKYCDTDIPRYFVMLSVVESFSRNNKKDKNIGEMYTLQAAKEPYLQKRLSSRVQSAKLPNPFDSPVQSVMD